MARTAKIVLCVTKRIVGAACIRKYAWRPFSVPRITFQRAKNEIPHREGSAEVREVCVSALYVGIVCVRARACVCVCGVCVCVCVMRTLTAYLFLIIYFREMQTNGTDPEYMQLHRV